MKIAKNHKNLTKFGKLQYSAIAFQLVLNQQVINP